MCLLSKISLERIRRNLYHNVQQINFPGELSQNFVRTHTIFQQAIPQEQIFFKIASSDAFSRVVVCKYFFSNIRTVFYYFTFIFYTHYIEHIKFSRRKLPGELSRNFVRTHMIFLETIPPRTDIL